MLKFRFSANQLLEGQGVCREERAVLGRANCGNVEADRARDDGGGGLQSDQVRELKPLQEENTRLKKLVAELSRDKAILQDLNSNKWPGLR